MNPEATTVLGRHLRGREPAQPPVRIHRPEGITYAGVPYARQYVPWAREAELAGIADENEALRALLLCSAAYDLGADSLVTGSPVLLRQPPKSMTARSNPMTTTEAVALVGLFLRGPPTGPSSPSASRRAPTRHGPATSSSGSPCTSAATPIPASSTRPASGRRGPIGTWATPTTRRRDATATSLEGQLAEDAKLLDAYLSPTGAHTGAHPEEAASLSEN